MLVQTPPVDYSFINTATTTVCRQGPGKLVRVVFTATQTFTAMIYDGESTTSTMRTMASISISAADKQVGQFEFGCSFYNSLIVVTTGAPVITVIFE